MGKYGKAAVIAVELVKSGKIKKPDDAWEIATSKVFGKGTPSQCKGCPKGAFLGLCEERKIKDIPSGRYTKSKKNKNYAIKAVNILQADSNLCNNEQILWNKVVSGEHKQHNQQMDVVTTLWKNDLINMRS
jgi:hypothetical protein